LTLVSIKNGIENNSNFIKIGLSDGSSFHIKDHYWNYFYKISCSENSHESVPAWNEFASLEIGTEILPTEEEVFRFAASCYRAERTGMRLIARAEQTRAGLTRKLLERGHEGSCVYAVLDWLIQADLVNDQRYAERWLRSRLFRRSGRIYGPRRLSLALGNRGIDRDDLKKAFEITMDEETEFSLLRRFILKEKSKNFPGNYSLRGRLRYEGFSSPVIERYFDEITEE